MTAMIGLLLAGALETTVRCPPDNPNAIGAVEFHANLPIEQMRVVEFGVVVSTDPILNGTPLGFIHRLANGDTFFQSRRWDLIPPASLPQVYALLEGGNIPKDDVRAIGSYEVLMHDVDATVIKASARYLRCAANRQT